MMAAELESPALEPTAVPELLAPAGDWDCARAAVENGADSIYFGLDRFNARLRARNFTEADLPGLMGWLHARGVRGYVTFNTLVFTNELEQATAYLRALIAAGVDAAIVQDIGLCRLIRRLSPDFPIHASTQMTITSAAGVEFARALGCELVVLARENSISEIEHITASLREREASLPLEVFVHGALCVAYSGQCLTSEALGGRSANRGECAQACRLPYELISDGRPVDVGDRRYLLSPQDLAGLDVLPGLVRAGVGSLKIEGRLKSPEYVGSITRVYRTALDRITGRQSRRATGQNPALTPWPVPPKYAMEMAFSRGLHTGWLEGIDNRKLVHARFGTKRGVFVGTVARVGPDRVWLNIESTLKAGDGVVFDSGRPDLPEEGGRVFAIDGPMAPRGVAALAFLHGAVNLRRIRTGDRVWKTSDPEFDHLVRQSFAGEKPHVTHPVIAEVHGCLGSPLSLSLRDDSGNVVRADSAMPLQHAERQPLTEQRLRQQFGRLGGTPFHLAGFTVHLEHPLILPLAELNRVRRDAVARLMAQRTRPRRWTLREVASPHRGAKGSPLDTASAIPGVIDVPPDGPSAAWASPSTAANGAAAPRSHLIVLVRTDEQLDRVLAAGVETVYCEFEDPRRYREAVRKVRSASTGRGVEVFVAPPRIFKPGEDWILKQVRSAEPDGFLVRNYDHLEAFREARCIGDFSLNIANPLTAEYFRGNHRLERLTASYDLNADQLEALLLSAPAEWFEITLHQHMPMFHMEHCVFCAFLSSGKDFRDCGRPCDRHDVRLRDRVGAQHPVKADAGCRNTVFNARAQTGADHLPRFQAAGGRHFRIEFLTETGDDITRLINRYRELLQGRTTPEQLWREFRLIPQLGVTRGQLGREDKSTVKSPKGGEPRVGTMS